MIPVNNNICLLLAGQFLGKILRLRSTRENRGHVFGHLTVNENGTLTKVRAYLRSKFDFVQEKYYQCWTVRHAFKGLISGQIDDYYRPNLFY